MAISFKSVLSALRVAVKPGGVFLATGVNPQPNLSPEYETNSNGDPSCDKFGSQWVRDAGAPIGFFDSSNPFDLENQATPGQSFWETFLGVQAAFVGQADGSGRPCCLFQVRAIHTGAVYLQLFRNNNGVVPINGSIPDFVMPVPADPLEAVFSPGVATPWNAVAGLGGGIAIVFSTTRDTLTLATAGVITANWAFYNYNL